MTEGAQTQILAHVLGTQVHIFVLNLGPRTSPRRNYVRVNPHLLSTDSVAFRNTEDLQKYRTNI